MAADNEDRKIGTRVFKKTSSDGMISSLSFTSFLHSICWLHDGLHGFFSDHDISGEARLHRQRRSSGYHRLSVGSAR
ncbi:hypothetical protein PMAYCL1PPCAC_04617 [Pristionchus mayeri]|uniref:Uncharacterized protein n=1 Tax=Pristionchus mayeri TaxID=1317129 RepID=A0AAN4ZAV9_9BILA|nr:hypothetical protein PMAYCL1PPCAC_04617 [Pristionchus mayeri]